MENLYQSTRRGHTDAVANDLRDLLRTARTVLDGSDARDEAWKVVPRLSVICRGSRNTVLRARVPNAESATDTFVLKLSGDDAELADADLIHMLALTGSGVVPDVVGEVAEVRAFAMADAGDETLERMLEVGTPLDVSLAVARMARTYARLHVEGRSLVGRTEALRDSILTRELAKWMDGVEVALPWLQLCDNDRRVRRALARITTTWYAAREDVTLTHGDPAPSNVMLPSDGDARLVDFEFGAPRHPMYDIAAWDVFCPLPPDLVQTLRDEYSLARTTLGWPLEEFHASYAPLVAFRALQLLASIPAQARLNDSEWAPGWTARQAIICTLERLAIRCQDDSELQRLAECAATSASHWRTEWPEVSDVLPRWPAFRGAGAFRGAMA